jgi:hypothetical protein
VTSNELSLSGQGQRHWIDHCQIIVDGGLVYQGRAEINEVAVNPGRYRAWVGVIHLEISQKEFLKISLGTVIELEFRAGVLNVAERGRGIVLGTVYDCGDSTTIELTSGAKILTAPKERALYFVGGLAPLPATT